MWLFVTTHGDEDRGDLFFMTDGAAPVVDVRIFSLFNILEL